MGLSVTDLNDLVNTTKAQFGELKWTDMTGDLQEYIAMPKLMKKEKVTVDSGKRIEFSAMNGLTGNAKNVGLFETDDYNAEDRMLRGYVDWKHTNTNYMIERREVAMNRSPSRIVELVKVRRADALISLAALMEENFWQAASSASADPHSVYCWIVQNATEGFSGGNPSGFTSGIGNIDSDTYTRWKNWSANYTTVDRTDFVRKARKAARNTNFKPPIDISQYHKGDKFGYYTNEDVIEALEELLEGRNENLGVDLAKYQGEVLFRRTPVTWVPYLDDDTTDPFFGINWGSFEFVFLEGEYMNESEARKAPHSHTTSVVDIDCTYNTICRDRRRQFVIYK